MEEKIANLIYNRVKQNKEIDGFFIKEFIDIVMVNWNINKYNGDFSIEKLDPKFLGAYNEFLNIIRVNCSILNDKNFITNNYKINRNDLLARYLLLTQLLLHELIHCSQFDVEGDRTVDIEKYIINWSLKPMIDLHKHELNCNGLFGKLDKLRQIKHCINLFRKYYIYLPHERIAEIDSCSISSNIAEILEDNYIKKQLLIRMYQRFLFYDFKKMF